MKTVLVALLLAGSSAAMNNKYLYADYKLDMPEITARCPSPTVANASVSQDPQGAYHILVEFQCSVKI